MGRSVGYGGMKEKAVKGIGGLEKKWGQEWEGKSKRNGGIEKSGDREAGREKVSRG